MERLRQAAEAVDAPVWVEHDRSDAALAEELARVLWDSDQATLAARSAGFPVQSMPAFRSSRVFWARVVEDARNGAMRGGVKALAEAAAKLFPSNPVFSRYAGS